MNEPVDRRHFIATTASGAAAVMLSAAAGGTAAAATPPAAPAAAPRKPRALASVRPFPLTAVTLLPGAFKDNQSRNTAYLRYVDIDRLLHTFRLNVGIASSARPCGGWESPTTELRGHSTGHLLSGLALTYANTGEAALLDKSRKLVSALAACQAKSPAAGYGTGYLSAFPENFCARLPGSTPAPRSSATTRCSGCWRPSTAA